MSNTEFASDGNYPAGSDDWSGQPRKLALSNSEASAGFTPDAPIPAEVLNYLFGCAFPSVVTHTASGTGLVIPNNVLYIDVSICGGGGGGASGAGPGGNNGGNGGGAGLPYRTRIPRELVGATYDVTIGAGGAGGAGGVTGATNANIGSDGGFTALTFAGPFASPADDLLVQAAGGQGGQLLTGGIGYSGGGGAGADASGAGHGGALGGGGQDGGGGTGRTGGTGATGTSYLGTPSGAGGRGGSAAVVAGVALQAGGGGGGGPFEGSYQGNSGVSGAGSHTNAGQGGRGRGAGGGGGGQGATSSGAGGAGLDGVAIITFWRGIP